MHIVCIQEITSKNVIRRGWVPSTMFTIPSFYTASCGLTFLINLPKKKILSNHDEPDHCGFSKSILPTSPHHHQARKHTPQPINVHQHKIRILWCCCMYAPVADPGSIITPPSCLYALNWWVCPVIKISTSSCRCSIANESKSPHATNCSPPEENPHLQSTNPAMDKQNTFPYTHAAACNWCHDVWTRLPLKMAQNSSSHQQYLCA